MKSKRTDILILSLLIFLASFGVYFLTASRTVNFIDSGELITVCHTLGVAHPTGYPLYTILGRIFSLFPSSSPAFPVNLMSALFSSVAAVVFFFLVLEIASRLRKARLRRGGTYPLVAFSSALIFATSNTLWGSSVQAEVYSLAVLFFVLLLYILLHWEKTGDYRLFFLFFYIYGLSFGDHMLAVLYSVGFLYLIYSKLRRRLFSAKVIIPAVFFFLLGLSIYLYLPIRSSCHPFMNWGNPSDFERFFRHISGWQYRVWMFNQSIGALVHKFGSYILLLLSQYWFLILLAPLGIFSLVKGSKRIFWFLIIIFFSNIVYSLNYDIPDIAPYFLPSFAIFSLFIAIGMDSLYKILLRFGRIAPVVSILCIAPFVANFSSNFYYPDRRAEELGRNILSPLDTGSVALLHYWDFVAPSIYLQQMLGFRRDVLVIDFELLRRSWYVRWLLEQFPDRFSDYARSKMRSFAMLVLDFERGRAYNPRQLELSFRQMINSILVSSISSNRTVFVSDAIPDWVLPGYHRLPEFLLYRVSKDKSVRILPFRPELSYARDSSLPGDRRINWFMRFYPDMLSRMGLSYCSLGQLRWGVRYLWWSADFVNYRPEYSEPLLFYLATAGRDDEASMVLERVDSLYHGTPAMEKLLRKLGR